MNDTPDPVLDASVPPLRRDIVLEDGPSGGGFLEDPVRRRRIRVDARGLEILRLLDRAQTRQALVDRIAAAGRPIAPEALGRVLDAFESLGILADEDADPPDDPGEIDPDTVPLLIDPAIRYTCTACGSCCCGVNIPFDRVALERLDAARQDVLKAEMGVIEPPVVVLEGEDEGVAMPLCRTRNHACVFLEGRLCGLHRRWGAESKPLVCRAFPLELLRTPRGISVGLQMECRDILRAGQGAPLADQVDSIREILRQVGTIGIARDQVGLDGCTFLAWEEYERLEGDVLQAMEATPGGGFVSLAAAGRVLADRCAATGRPLPVPDANPETLRSDVLEFLREVGARLVALRRRLREEGAGLLIRTVNADAIQEAISEIPPWLDRVLDSDEEGEALSFARLCARNVWGSKECLRTSDLAGAQAMAVLRWLLARAGAITSARHASRAFCTPQDLVDAWIRAHFLMRNRRVIDALAPLREEAVRLFVGGLPTLLDARAHLATPDGRSEFHLL